MSRELAILMRLNVRRLEQVYLHSLQGLTGNSIFTIDELDQMVATCAHGTIILDHDVLQRLDQTSRDVASLSSLDSRINQSFTASHSVEVELSRAKAE